MRSFLRLPRSAALASHNALRVRGVQPAAGSRLRSMSVMTGSSPTLRGDRQNAATATDVLRSMSTIASEEDDDFFELQEIKRLTEIQITIENDVHHDSVMKYKEMRDSVVARGSAIGMKATQKMFLGWFEPLTASITQEIRDYEARKPGVDRSVYGPYLYLLKPEVLAAITINTFINLALMEARGVKVVRAASAIGSACEAEVAINRMKEEKKGMAQDTLRKKKHAQTELIAARRTSPKYAKFVDRHDSSRYNKDIITVPEEKVPDRDGNLKYRSPKMLSGKKADDAMRKAMEEEGLPSADIKEFFGEDILDADLKPYQHVDEEAKQKQSRLTYQLEQIASTKDKMFIERKVRAASKQGNWGTKIRVKIGALLLAHLLQTAKVERTNVEGTDRESKLLFTAGESEKMEPAFQHCYIFQHPRRFGALKCHPEVFNIIMKDDGDIKEATPRYLPMIVKPKPWTAYNEGGYLTLKSLIMRSREKSAGQIKALKNATMPDLLDGLNALGECPWKINVHVLGILEQLWEEGDGAAGLPRRTDFEIPEPPEEFDLIDDDDEEGCARRRHFKKQVNKLKRINQDLHSLRCDAKLKIDIAKKYGQYEQIYFPYNIDFRGRAYPIPPNLNHLGADLCRGVLQFAEKKPLGPDGLYWMKVHLANLVGQDKLSFTGRFEYINTMLDEVRDSARDPLGGNRWWLEADEPFQALACMIEVAGALEMEDRGEDPGQFMSQIPVHMDGSCNGLQHYAALGRDVEGAKQVNLIPSDIPQDVYTGVANRVIEKVEIDAEMDTYDPDPEKERIKKRDKSHALLVRGHIGRKVVKQTVMTSVYGVTFVGARKQIQVCVSLLLSVKGN
jgi:DNA-directed RNA polymerase